MKNVIQEKLIQVVAEEYSDQAAKLYCKSGISLLKAVAQELNLEHRYCDPDLEERESLREVNDTEREKFWALRIDDLGERSVLFLCGDNHVDSFKQLLESQRRIVSIDSTHWGDELIGEPLL